MNVPRLPLIMGVVNVTPDSFYDGGKAYSTPDAVERALLLLEQGADIIDIGGESSRPPGKNYGNGAERISATEECRRTIPVIKELIARRPDAIISIDTIKSEVAGKAIEVGASIVNDVSAGRFDSDMFAVAAAGDVSYVLMHGYDPENIRPTEEFSSAGVVREVYRFLEERIAEAGNAGIERIIADVGIGFSKGATANMELLRHHRQFTQLGVPLLVGASRKAFIGNALGGKPPEDRLFGTLGAHAAAVVNGAAMLRVHDVAATVQFFDLFNSLAGAGKIGVGYGTA